MKKKKDFDFYEPDNDFDSDNNRLYDDEKSDSRVLKSKKPITNNKMSVLSYFIAGVLSTIVICGVSIGGYLYYNTLPQNTVKDYKDYFSDYRQFASVEDTYVKLNNNVLVQNESVYIPYSFVKKYIDEYIFYEPDANIVSITNDTNVIRMSTEEDTYYVNDEQLKLTLPILKHDNTAYLPLDLVNNTYNVEVKYDFDSGLLQLNYNELPSTVSSVKGKTKVRFNYTEESFLTTYVEDDESFEVYDEYDEYTKIRTSDGYLGYIPTSKVTEKVLVEPTVKDVYTPKNLRDEKITLLWDQIYNYDANKLPNKQLLPEGVDVVSPTWFKFDENSLDGTIISLADTSYVDAIHSQGGEVWPILTDNFSSKVSSAILRSPENRKNVIRQILALSILFELDGINIDFEAVQPSDSEYFVQFLRELYPHMKKNGLVLSVDTFVPSDWSMYYNRKAIGETVDYVAVMTYDEHTSGSPTTGPVASLDFVDKGIQDTLKEVSKNQVLMGIPFYTRVWKVKEDGSYTISNRSMNSAIDLFTRNNATFTEDIEAGYTYATFDFVENGETIKYEAWLENSDSIRKKLEIYDKYDIGGVALWSRDLEQKDTFRIINEVVN